MPPRPKFKKDEILDAAFSIARQEGIEKVTARELGARLGSSARPVFTVFENMEEVKKDVVSRSRELYGRYIEEALKQEKAFRAVGIAYVAFAMREPLLFQMLFMRKQEKVTGISSVLPEIDDNYESILQSVQEPYGLSRPAAERIYQHLWTYTHGIATMCATNICKYTEEEIAERTTEIFKSLLMAEQRGDFKRD